jgi:hypothetical protein
MYKRGGDLINNNTITFGNFSTESSKSTKKKTSTKTTKTPRKTRTPKKLPKIPHRVQPWVKEWLELLGYTYQEVKENIRLEKSKDPKRHNWATKIGKGNSATWYLIKNENKRYLKQESNNVSNSNSKNPYTWIVRDSETLRELNRATNKRSTLIILRNLWKKLSKNPKYKGKISRIPIKDKNGNSISNNNNSPNNKVKKSLNLSGNAKSFIRKSNANNARRKLNAKIKKNNTLTPKKKVSKREANNARKKLRNMLKK